MEGVNEHLVSENTSLYSRGTTRYSVQHDINKKSNNKKTQRKNQAGAMSCKIREGMKSETKTKKGKWEKND